MVKFLWIYFPAHFANNPSNSSYTFNSVEPTYHKNEILRGTNMRPELLFHVDDKFKSPELMCNAWRESWKLWKYPNRHSIIIWECMHFASYFLPQVNLNSIGNQIQGIKYEFCQCSLLKSLIDRFSNLGWQSKRIGILIFVLYLLYIRRNKASSPNNIYIRHNTRWMRWNSILWGRLTYKYVILHEMMNVYLTQYLWLSKFPVCVHAFLYNVLELNCSFIHPTPSNNNLELITGCILWTFFCLFKTCMNIFWASFMFPAFKYLSSL